MIIPIKFMLNQARSEGYGFLRVVVTNLEEIEAVLAAAEETGSPIGFSVNEPEGQFPRYRSFESLIMGAADKADVPVGVQFDHTEDMTLILRAIRGGYNGIMVDASHHPLEENIATTRRVVEMCHPLDILVEGEVGIIARTWDDCVEDEPDRLTDPEAAGEYVEKTGVDALAVSIGEITGFDSGRLDFGRLRQIKAKLGDTTHLCLHGSSFVDDDDIRKCLAGGMSYFGCATEFRAAFFHKLGEVARSEGPEMVDPTLLFTPARDAMKEKIIQKIRLLGCEAKAHGVISDYFSRIEK